MDIKARYIISLCYHILFYFGKKKESDSEGALATPLHDLEGESFYSHIILLKYDDADTTTNTLPIHRHIQRIKTQDIMAPST